MKKFKYVYGEDSIEFFLIPLADADKYYNALLREEDPSVEEYIFNQITKDKYSIEDIPPGVVLSVIFSALKMSGVLKDYKELPDKIDETRERLGDDIISTFQSIIIKTMPSYNPDTLNEKTMNELFSLVVMAEKIAGQKLIDTDQIRKNLDPGNSNKGIKGTTKEEINKFKELLDQQNPFDGPPI